MTAETIANIVKNSFGPLEFCRWRHGDKRWRKNLWLLEVKIEASEMLMELSQLQDEEVGDRNLGCNSGVQIHCGVDRTCGWAESRDDHQLYQVVDELLHYRRQAGKITDQRGNPAYSLKAKNVFKVKCTLAL